MPFYQKQGQFPHKRHTQFRKDNGELYHEELFGTIGFEGMSSLLYHNHPPTMVKEVGESIDIAPKIAIEKNMKAYRLKGFDVKPTCAYTCFVSIFCYHGNVSHFTEWTGLRFTVNVSVNSGFSKQLVIVASHLLINTNKPMSEVARPEAQQTNTLFL